MKIIDVIACSASIAALLPEVVQAAPIADLAPQPVARIVQRTPQEASHVEVKEVRAVDEEDSGSPDPEADLHVKVHLSREEGLQEKDGVVRRENGGYSTSSAYCVVM